jgi:SAM-dependent methyltransferase
MLNVARGRADIEWVLGDPTSIHFGSEFDLIVMTGNAFQVFVEDDDVRASLAALRSFLTEDGRFAFDTRNPAGKEWERWSERISEVAHAGTRVRTEAPAPVYDGRLLTFTTVYTSPDWDAPEVSHSTLRVFGVDELASFLTEAGLVIEEQFGDFERQPLTDASLEIVTVARRA